jgi:hypothetical protein
MHFDTWSDAMLHVHCCTRKDNEGFRLAQVRDTLIEGLSDEDATDGKKRITFYQSHPTDAWVSLGAILVLDHIESPQYESEDGTKYKTIDVFLGFASII